MELKERIKKLRKDMELSQSKFANKYSLPVRTLQQWEQGRGAPPEYIVIMMEKLYEYEKDIERLKKGDAENVGKQ